MRYGVLVLLNPSLANLGGVSFPAGVASSIGTTCNVKETWKANNIYFSLAIDYRGLYNGSDEHVMKAAGAALRAGIAYSQLRIKVSVTATQRVCFPLC